MNVYKTIILSLGLLAIAKANQAATPLPDLVGLRCEFNGAIEFSLKQRKFDFTDKFVSMIRKQHPERLYDASNIHNLKIGQFVNGEVNYKCRLEADQWVWVMDDTHVHVTLIPYQHIHLYPHNDVYFYNTFNNPLSFKLIRYDLMRFKNDIHIITPGISDVTLGETFGQESFETFYFLLQPKQAIKYPIALKLNLTLETAKS